MCNMCLQAGGLGALKAVNHFMQKFAGAQQMAIVARDLVKEDISKTNNKRKK